MIKNRRVPRNGLLRPSLVTIAAVMAVSSVSGTAYAQASGQNSAASASDPSNHLEEIVVTAQRRTESLQKSALAVTAVSGDTLRKLGVSTAQDLTQVVPNLVIGQNGSSAQVGMRGAMSTTPGPFADQAVGFSVNGVYLARGGSAMTSLFDINQVEVLRGPQGTLYGRNTIAGLINVITNKPNLDRIEGRAEAGYGAYNELETQGMLNVPVSSTFGLRAAFSSDRHDGYSNNSPGRNQNDLESVAGRVEALWKPSDKFDALLALSAYHNGGVGGGAISGGAPLGLYATSAGATPFNYQVAAKNAYTDQLTRDATLTLNYQLPFATVTYVGNVRSDHYAGAGPLSVQGPIAKTFAHGLCATVNDPTCFELSLQNNGSQNSHELRIGHDSDRLKWVIGAYYFRYHDTNFTTQSPSPTGALIDVYKPGANVEMSHAVFGQATWSPIKALRLTGGVRYNDEFKNTFSQTYNGVLGAAQGFTCASCVPVAAQVGGPVDVKKVTWRAGADVDLTKDMLLFASVANGFKNGGINTTGTTFLPEVIKNYELGFKTSLLDRHLQINIDAFHELYTNYQSTAGQLANGTVSLVTVNAGKATIDGVELESVALITPRDRLSLNGTYLNARFTSFYLPFGDGFNGNVAEDLAGNRVPYAPRVTLRLDYQHTFRLASGATIVPHVDSSYVADQELDYHNFAVLHVPSYTRTGLSLTYNAPKDDGHMEWSVTAWVKNLENNAVLVTGQADNTVPLAVMGQAGKDGFYLPPRTYGVKVSATF